MIKRPLWQWQYPKKSEDEFEIIQMMEQFKMKGNSVDTQENRKTEISFD